MEIKPDRGISPLMLRMTISLFCIGLILALFYLARTVVVPVIFAVLFGILLRPVERFLNKKLRIPRVIAILITVFLFLLVIGAIVFLATFEITRFVDDLPTLQKNLDKHFTEVRQWALVNLHMNYSTQEEYIDNATKETLGNPGLILQKTMASLSVVLTAVIALPVLLFLVLYYRPQFLDFLRNAFGTENKTRMEAIITDTRAALQGYIAGLFLEMLSVTVLQTLAMYIAGVPYALLIGLITGVLNMIPYLGIIIASGIALLIALASGNTSVQIFYMLIGFASVQFIDNNILLPRLVGSRVQINAFFSIVGVLAGGIVCGVAGMFLAIPLMALLKVIFDNIDHLKRWSELMGDSMPKTKRWRRIHFPKID